MANRSAFLIQILSKIGAPLLSAVESTRGKAATDNHKDAETLASLLSRSVEMSVLLSQNMDLRGSEEDADSLRLALAALAGPLIADIYEHGGKIPDETDLKRVQKAMESVLTFSDNFAPSAAHIGRLKALDDTPVHSDDDQNIIYVLQAFVPVIGAIAEFPFGQSESALIQDIVARLDETAKDFLSRILPGVESEPGKARYVELMILKALAALYADCYRAQTKKLTDDPDMAEQITIDAVWSDFGTKKAMMEAVIQASIPGAASVESGQGDPVAPPPPPAPEMPAPPPVPPVEQNIQQPVPAPEQPPSEAESLYQPDPVVPEAPPAPPAAAGGPMSFFTKKDAPATPETPAAPPSQPQPPASPQNQAPPPPPVQPQPPADQSSAPPPDASGNPMAFFKPGAKNQSDSEQ